MLSPAFYQRFAGYDFVLLHQPDAFVFKDDLLPWCRRAYSYVGPPWQEGLKHAAPDSSFIGVGNGGFSLRRIADFLRMTKAHRDPAFWIKTTKALFLNGPVVSRPYRRFLKQTTPLLRSFLKRPTAEDLVFGRTATSVDPDFTVPDPLTALHFAIETHPRANMALLGGATPFGTHAWWTYDLNFWRPYIEQQGHRLPSSVQR